ncbi:MAG: FtsX-like permease family protein [Gammaproteobacteria bacterium]|nr:FtsX-like permease family protein [Gammaproteobacteria bacterium]
MKLSILSLTLKSIYNRKFTAIITIFSIAISVALLLGVEKIRTEARLSFANTISGSDLIVGARSGSIQLLLYSVFRIGQATNNVSWESYQSIIKHPKVKWSIPMSLGDSHRNFRVMGTTQDYFKYYQYSQHKALKFSQGSSFVHVYDTVLGADVAKKLNYHLGQSIILAHGSGKINLHKHEDKPFKVVGILKPTGTPVDQTIYISLSGMEAIHLDWQQGVPTGLSISAQKAEKMDLQPKAITAFMLGLTSKVNTFQVQRMINDFPQEPLLAILPGIALQELWSLMSVAEQALKIISVFVVATGLLGMLTVILTSLNERRREIAILRSVGARPWHVFLLLMSESLSFAVLGCLLGVILLYVLLLIAQPLMADYYGLHIAISSLSTSDVSILGLIISASFVMGIVPGFRAYRASLMDGLTLRI